MDPKVFEAFRRLMETVSFIEVINMQHGPKGFHGQGFLLDLKGRQTKILVDFRELDAICNRRAFSLGGILFGDRTTKLITPKPQTILAGELNEFVCRHTSKRKKTLSSWISCATELYNFVRLIVGGTPAFSSLGIPTDGAWANIQARKLVDFGKFYADGQHIGEFLFMFFFKSEFRMLVKDFIQGTVSDPYLENIRLGNEHVVNTPFTVRRFMAEFLSNLQTTTIGVSYTAEITQTKDWLEPVVTVPAAAAPVATRWGPPKTPELYEPAAVYFPTAAPVVPVVPVPVTSAPTSPAYRPTSPAYRPEDAYDPADVGSSWYPALSAFSGSPTVGPPALPLGGPPSGTTGSTTSSTLFGTGQWHR